MPSMANGKGPLMVNPSYSAEIIPFPTVTTAPPAALTLTLQEALQTVLGITAKEYRSLMPVIDIVQEWTSWQIEIEEIQAQTANGSPGKIVALNAARRPV